MLTIDAPGVAAFLWAVNLLAGIAVAAFLIGAR